MKQLLSLFTCLCLFHITGAAEWNYDNGQVQWGNLHAVCINGREQSPVNIEEYQAEYDRYMVGPIAITYSSAMGLKLINNGHTVKLSIESGMSYISEGGLPGDKFQLAQLHFHWGDDNTKGSEHVIDHMAYPAELHLVHFNTKFGNISNALDKKTGLAVLGIFIMEGEHNAAFDNIMSKLSMIMYRDQSTLVESFDLTTLMPKDKAMYFRYNGSLTTPSCDETVTWTVFRQPVQMSTQQLAEFRKLQMVVSGQPDSPMVNNYREVQELYDRKMYKSLPGDRPRPGTAATMSSSMILSALAVICTLLLHL